MLTLGFFVVSTAFADDQAEVRRLEGELVKHAQRNSWSAVDNLYRRIVAINPPRGARTHLLGAQAALDQGHALLAYRRLRRIPAEEGGEDYRAARSMMAGLEQRYGLVSIYVPADKLPAMARPLMPFAQEERDAVAVARETLRVEGAFRGLLPEGEYSVDGHPFVVEADWREWLVIVVGDPSTASPPSPSEVPAPAPAPPDDVPLEAPVVDDGSLPPG